MSFIFGPDSASVAAQRIDVLFYALLGLAGVIILIVTGLIFGFSARFRRDSSADRRRLPLLLRHEVEASWTVAIAFIALFFFWWTSTYQVARTGPPEDAMEIHVVAKQWMWKAEHPNGAREIDGLHVPVGQPVALYMNSQDVIHSFFVPDFRLKQDVVPGRTSVAWFEATKTGEFALRCAEYCGTSHARMTGTVTVMTPGDYAQWAALQPQSENLAAEGKALFTRYGCSGCHAEDSAIHAPSLDGLFGTPVHLRDGGTVQADQAYIRDSILLPKKDIVAGYAAIMPDDFDDLLSQGQVTALVAYIRSLSVERPRVAEPEPEVPAERKDTR